MDRVSIIVIVDKLMVERGGVAARVGQLSPREGGIASDLVVTKLRRYGVFVALFECVVSGVFCLNYYLIVG